MDALAAGGGRGAAGDRRGDPLHLRPRARLPARGVPAGGRVVRGGARPGRGGAGAGRLRARAPGRACMPRHVRWLQAQGVPFVPHAGEAVGPEAVWEALRFDPPRIGHGFRAADDPALVAASRGAASCWSSARRATSARAACRAWPPTRCAALGRGRALTLNSDDPPMFNTTLLDEYRVAASVFGFTPADLAAGQPHGRRGPRCCRPPSAPRWSRASRRSCARLGL